MSIKRHLVFLVPILIPTVVAGILFATGVVDAAGLDSKSPTPGNSSPVGSHTYYLRQSPDQGIQDSVKLSAYYTANGNWGQKRLKIAPGTDDNVTKTDGPKYICKTSGSSNNYINITITDAMNSASTVTYQVAASDVCKNTGSQFYTQFALPTKPTKIDPSTGRYKMIVTIKYGPSVTPNDNVGLRFIVNAVNDAGADSTALIGVRGGSSYAFPVLANWDLRNDPNYQNITIPFGLVCGASATSAASIGVYDADNGTFPRSLYFRIRNVTTGEWVNANTTQRVDASDQDLPAGNDRFVPQDNTDGKKGYANVTINMTPNTHYEMSIFVIHPQNTIDVQLPTSTDSISGADGFSCLPGDHIPTEDTVTVSSHVSGVINGAGTGASFSTYATIENFPANPTQWGYDEVAVGKASNTGAVANPQIYAPLNDDFSYTPQYIKCDTDSNEANGGLYWNAGPSYGACNYYYCANNGKSQAKSNRCGEYRWQCNSGSGLGTYEINRAGNGSNGPGNPVSGCAEYRHMCMLNGSSQMTWFNDNSSPGNVCTKYVCPNFDTNFADNCKVFVCRGSTATFFIGREKTIDEASVYCAATCSNGLAAPVANDTRCYRPPAFNVQCVWDGPEGGTTVQTVTKDNYTARFCEATPNTTITRSTINSTGQVCAASTPGGGLAFFSDGTYQFPGKGDVGNGTKTVNDYRTTWSIAAQGDSACIQLGGHPYFSVLGGDMAAGLGFGATCGNVSGASIIGSNNDTGNYEGATGQLAALALGTVKSFATGKSQNGGLGPVWTDSISGNSSPSKLGFANSIPPVGGSTYGGSLGAQNWCSSDYYKKADDSGPTNLSASSINVTSLYGQTSKLFKHSGDLNLTNGVIPANGEVVTLVVEGNVYISGGNITYAAAANASKIPQFRLLVKGDIRVDKAITELNGFYAAQGTSGLFVTCANTAGALVGTASTLGCSNQLTVRGAIAANQIILNRTVGDRNGQFSQQQKPAEILRYSPQSWIPYTLSGGIGKWQSVTSLPPIL